MADHDEIERLHAELAEVRASRARLVRAADAHRRSIERELHGGVQQQLVALAMRLQLAESALEGDPAAAKALLEEIGRDVQDALDEAARLAQRISVPLLELGLATALRSALGERRRPAPSGGLRRPDWPARDPAHSVRLLAPGARAPGDTRPAITVQEDARALVFEVVRGGAPPLPGSTRCATASRRSEACSRFATEPDGGARVSGSLPLSR